MRRTAIAMHKYIVEQTHFIVYVVALKNNQIFCSFYKGHAKKRSLSHTRVCEKGSVSILARVTMEASVF